MLLYRVTYTGPDGVVTNEWFPDLAAAMRERERQRQNPGANPRFQQVEVPTDKRGLLDWLNTEPNTPKYTEAFYA